MNRGPTVAQVKNCNSSSTRPIILLTREFGSKSKVLVIVKNIEKRLVSHDVQELGNSNYAPENSRGVKTFSLLPNQSSARQLK